MNTTVKTLATVAAYGADAVSSNGFLYLADMPPMLGKGIKPTSVIAPVTEVSQITTYTPSASQNSTNFQLSLEYVNKVTGVLESTTLVYNSNAVMLASDVCDGFRAALAAKSSIIPIVGSGTATLILTAAAGYSTFISSNIGVGVMSVAATQAGVTRVGYGADLINGDYTDSNLVSTSYYYSVYMKYGNSDSTGSAQKTSPLVDINVLYVLSTATNAASLVGTTGTLTTALTGKNISAPIAMTTSSTLAYTQATGVITMTGGSGTFTSQNINVGDILFIDLNPTTSTVPIPVLLITTNLLGVSTIGLNGAADIGAGAYHIVHVTA